MRQERADLLFDENIRPTLKKSYGQDAVDY
jgi:hypothetical protein